MSGNVTPTPIVDKNGKQTTVHKKVGGDVSKSRVAGVGLPPAEKRFVIENPYGVPEGTLIEAVKIPDSDAQAIILNGARVGTVEKKEVNIGVGGKGKRYVSYYKKANRWFARTEGSETGVVGYKTDTFGDGETSRAGAVQRYVRGYFENEKTAKAIAEFFENGGEVFSKKGTSDTIIFRDREFKPIGQYAMGSTIGSGSDKPKNVLQVYTNKGQYNIELNGDDSKVVFIGGTHKERIPFPLDIVNGTIGNVREEDETFQYNVKVDQYDLYGNALRTVNQMFGNNPFRS